MHGLEACVFKYIAVAAFMLSMVKMLLKGEVGCHALYILIVMEITLFIIKNHGKIMKLCF